MSPRNEYVNTKTDEFHPDALLQKYFDKDLTLEEAEKLVAYWKAHPEFDSFACKNQQIHRVLKFFSSMEKKTISIEPERNIRLDFSSSASPFSLQEKESLFEPLSTDQIERLLSETAISIEQTTLKEKEVVTPKQKTVSPSKKTPRSIIILRRCVVCVVLLLLFAAIYQEFKSLLPTAKKNHSVEIARLVESVEAKWAEETQEYKNGRNLGQSSLKLLSGIVKLEFGNGSEVAMEGPCELLIKGRDRAFCQHGKISVSVPPRGVGFEIGSPLTTVVDLGTAFSMNVSVERTDVHVIEGKVEVLPSRKEKFILASGRGVQFDLKNETVFHRADPTSFLNDEKFQKAKQNYIFVREPVWQKRETSLTMDQGLVYQMVPERTGSCRRIPGSRTGKMALRLENKSNRIDTDIQREFRSLTLLASIRFHALEHISNTLLIGDLFYERPGNFLWQIDRSGSIQFHVRDDHHKVARYDSEPFISQNDCNTWLSLALVVDSDRRTISHYVDGKRIAEQPWNPSKPIRLNGATIGNVRPDRNRAAIRFCDADIEEFLIFDRPFNAREIENLYMTQH